MKTYEEYILELEMLHDDFDALKVKVETMETEGRLLQADVRQLQSDTRRLETNTRQLQTESSRVQQILQKDSINLTSLLFDTVYPIGVHPNAFELASGAIRATGGGVFTLSSDFDTTQRTKDAAGNLSIPPAFYAISVFCPDLTGGPGGLVRSTLYEGPINAGDITISLVRRAAASPTRIITNIWIYNPNATADVYIKVLKLLGVR